jgi:A/G-specific adenine glycosylase
LNVQGLLKINLHKKQIPAFRRVLLRWYCKNGRDLPWRQTRDPYRILVSEIMLQQTQVATVLPYYEGWLRRFPNFSTLAHASEPEVLQTWQGLGYYARARNLYATAKLVVDRYRTRFPTSIDRIRRLPGIGKYTAHAIVTFAFNEPTPIIEANTSRVLARLFDLRRPIDCAAGRNKLWEKAAALVPKENPRAYNSALIDLGALVCLPRNPKCGLCPVQRFCRAKNPESLPVKRARPETRRLVERHVFVASRSKLLLSQSTKRWGGMWILPQLNSRAKKNSAVYQAVFPFTNHRITLEIFRQRQFKIANRRQRWFPLCNLHSIPIPSPHRRAIEALLSSH